MGGGCAARRGGGSRPVTAPLSHVTPRSEEQSRSRIGILAGPPSPYSEHARVEGYIAKGKAEGARITVGGGRPASQPKGWFVEPTVFAEVDNASTIAQEEIFGPVLSVIAYEDDDDAVRIANDSAYGLGGAIWTGDPERGRSIARRVRTGTVGVNRYLSDAAAPFGGVKASGSGRDLGPEALDAHLEIKSIYV
ncbi:aldehyde dehydrogenase family protein [Kitasatospora sp. NPDC056531]|uniref:aldehyde dehydrogenase family protein n=1 Tax=Kitasatospora sp. NPDC056531 TaxID=3345856 RepID=UPI0036A4CF6F